MTAKPAPADCSRRQALIASAALMSLPLLPSTHLRACHRSGPEDWQRAIEKGLGWLAGKQTRLGHWSHATYPAAMTALAGTALICSGSTSTQGPWSENIRRAVDYLITKCRPNGLIGDPLRDNRYTYGHGFSMLFLSQVLGEEEDEDRREELTDVLQRAVEFSVNAQTSIRWMGVCECRGKQHL